MRILLVFLFVFFTAVSYGGQFYNVGTMRLYLPGKPIHKEHVLNTSSGILTLSKAAYTHSEGDLTIYAYHIDSEKLTVKLNHMDILSHLFREAVLILGPSFDLMKLEKLSCRVYPGCKRYQLEDQTGTYLSRFTVLIVPPDGWLYLGIRDVKKTSSDQVWEDFWSKSFVRKLKAGPEDKVASVF